LIKLLRLLTIQSAIKLSNDQHFIAGLGHIWRPDTIAAVDLKFHERTDFNINHFVLAEVHQGEGL
jgi:hypothetical protein